MRIVTFLVGLVVAFACEAHARSYGNGHGRAHNHGLVKRIVTATSTAIDAVETVVVYELHGNLIPWSEVKEGLANGTLEWAAESPHKHSHKHHHGHTGSPPSLVPIFSPTTLVTSQSPVTSDPIVSVPVVSLPKPTPTNIGHPPFDQDGTGIDEDFPDGEIDCSSFPSSYGAIPVHWLKLQGWTGIQRPQTIAPQGMDNILTVTDSLCASGQCCDEGSFCSYACPVGYQKAHWPQVQGATGQSIGGLQCKNGKLHLTNPELSRTLCIPGTDAVSVLVENKMATHASVCRTDYPGTEAETVPLLATPGKSAKLACPDASTYFHWKGDGTSAQYYVNPKGVNLDQACVWSNGNRDVGNWAPLNLGVGYDNGIAYVSMFQNSPTTDAPLDFTVELIGDDGTWDNLSSKCRYQDGQFCMGEDYSDCVPNTAPGAGCTVSLTSGSATYVFS